MKKRYEAEMERFCKFCVHGGVLSDPDKMLCKRHGIVDAGGCCRRFVYDPLKRIPTPAIPPLALHDWMEEFPSLESSSKTDTAAETTSEKPPSENPVLPHPKDPDDTALSDELLSLKLPAVANVPAPTEEDSPEEPG